MTLTSFNDSDLLKLCQEVLEKGNTFQFRALGGSMFPFIRPGDLLTTKAVDPTDLLIGEVLLYQREGRSFVHRLIKKKMIDGTHLFITHGDHLAFSDPAIRSSQILGKVTCIERRGRLILLDTPFRRMWGRFIAAASPCLFPLFQVVESPFQLFRRLSSRINLGLNQFRLIRKIKKRIFSQFSCRMASSSDIPSVAQFYETDLKEMSKEIEAGRNYYLAEKGGKVVGGFAAGSAWEGIDHDHRCWITGLFVVPRFRGASVAERLLTKAISTLREQGIDQIFVNVFGNNNPALKLFDKLGFTRADMPEIESKIDEHYAKVAPGSPPSFILYKRI